MVHQHFKLVHNFTVTENIILGYETTKGLVVDIKTASENPFIIGTIWFKCRS